MDASAKLSNFLDAGSSIEVLSAEEAHLHYGMDTGAAVRRLAGALIVKNSTVIEKILEIANQTNTRLWPISGGRNFGYGTALPVHDDSFLVDLGQLKGISLDLDSCTAEIEPGVTQADLYQAITHASVPWMVPTTGAGPNGSLLGNALDGGYGLNPICDHFEGFTQFSGYWANGTSFQHPLSEINCHEVASSWKQGIGPNWQGLLHQASFGIVTRARIQLVPMAESSRLVVFEFRSDAHFKSAIPRLKAITHDLPGLRGLFCNARLRIAMTQTPGLLHTWKALSPADRATTIDALAQRNGFPPWVALGFLYGSKYSVEGGLKDLKRHLPGVKIRAFSPQRVAWLKKLANILPLKDFLRSKVNSLSDAMDLLEGRPNPNFLQLAYALSTPTPMTASSHPAKEHCGVLWYAPLLPAQARAITAFLQQEVTEILHLHGFDALLAVALRNSSIFTSAIPILFDKTDASAVLRAKACYRALVKAGLMRGYPPYRLGIDYMDLLHDLPINAESGTWKQLKRVFDPNGILAPGRYVAPTKN
jgi:4-cresol dehydrogenase (hydroxylating) flavoprotein subunit